MTDTKSRLDAINAKILTENARLHDGLGKAIVVIWLLVIGGASVFVSAWMAEQSMKIHDQISQEATWNR